MSSSFQPVTNHRTDVDLGGLMAVISENLYSTPLVAVRELIQNAHDSVIRRRRGEPNFDGGVINLHLDENWLIVADDGEGMTRAELSDSLGVIGRGVTGALRRAGGDPDLIGQFGVGFLSAFLLGDLVRVISISTTRPDLAVVYQSSDGLDYTTTLIEDPAEGTPGLFGRFTTGTTVMVKVNRDSPAGAALAGPGALLGVVENYCALLRIPVKVDGKVVNHTPPWREHFNNAVEEAAARLAFAARYEHGSAPIATIPIVPDGRSDARGLIWVRDSSSYASSDNRNMAVYVRGMLLDGDARDLLPRWAGMVGGVIESGQLVPTAAREDIQRTEEYSAIAKAVESQLKAGLAEIASRQKPTWRRVVLRHNQALLGASVVDDELFDLLADSVEIATNEGDLRARDLVDRSTSRVHVSLTDNGGFEEVLCRCARVPVARGRMFGVLPFLRRWTSRHGVDLVEVGTPEAATVLFRPAELRADDLAWLTRGLIDPGEGLRPCRFAPAQLPLVLIPDREAELKQRIEDDEADARIPSAALSLARQHTATIEDRPPVHLYVNLDNPTVKTLLSARRQSPVAAAEALGALRHLKVVLGLAGDARGEGDLLESVEGLGRVIEDLARRDAADPGGEGAD